MELGTLEIRCGTSNMKVIFIMAGIGMQNGKPGVSGGDIRLIEIAKNWSKNNEIHIITSEGGRILCEKMGLNVKFHIIQSSEGTGIIENIRRVFYSLFYSRKIKKDILRDGVAYSSCEHLYDVLPAFSLKLKNKTKWVAVVHWVEDPPWEDKRGNTHFLPRYLYYLNRVVSIWIIRNFADKTLAVSQTTSEKLITKKNFTKNQIEVVSCGVDFQRIQEINPSNGLNKLEKKYDAIFMKRLNYGKGILDLLDIWKKVVDIKNNAKLAIIGDGSKEVISKLNDKIQEYNIGKNIVFLGVVYDFKEKFTILQQANLFILPSHEENWAIVIGEAMAAGVPIIAYDLKEIIPIWKDNVIWVRKGNTERFAEVILDMLNDGSAREKISMKAKDFVKKYEWTEIAENEHDIVQNALLEKKNYEIGNSFWN